MKKVLTTIALSLSALVATSAMAAPQHDPRYAPHKPAPHWDHKDAKKWDDRRDDRRWNPKPQNPLERENQLKILSNGFTGPAPQP